IIAVPRNVTPDDFLDKGEQFFPEFTDPNAATTLEVVEYNEETASAQPFKVTFKDGIWTIPSHYDYPADGKDQLAETAAGVIGLVKSDFRSGNVADHEACGVIDPLEQTSSLKGRGKRITIKDKNDQVLADLILGKEIEGRRNLRFVRLPDSKRVYITETPLEISTSFENWIEPDLLKVGKDDINKVTLKDYSINERVGTVDMKDTLVLSGTGETWTANRTPVGEEVDTTKMDALVNALDDLSIVGVRKKPDGLSESLKKSEKVPISRENIDSLRSRGFYFTRDGDLLSNEGELLVDTSTGLSYTLRFGEVLYGSGETVSAGIGGDEQEQEGSGENRYLFITVGYKSNLLPELPKPSNTDFQNKSETEWNDSDRRNKERFDSHREWEQKTEEGKQLAEDLTNRFSDWYYVIPASAFDRIHIPRSEMVVAKKD
ncbi:MAG: DUF4340 domain-containing protein, partial [Acidobacteriota bacterium]